MMERAKLMKRIIVPIAGVLLVGMIIFIVMIVKKENEQFAEYGIMTNATIIDKWKFDADRTKKVDMQYMVKISYFTQPGKEDEVSAVADTAHNDIHQTIDALFSEPSALGVYYTAECEISYAQFEMLEQGDQLQIMYLKNEPEQVRVAREK